MFDLYVCFYFNIQFRPIDTIAYFSGVHDKHGLSFGTRQMIFKELLKERVKRNIRLKSDKQEMPVSINRPVDTTPKSYVLLIFYKIKKMNFSYRKPAAAVIKLQPKTITPSSTNVRNDSLPISLTISFS